MIAFLADLAEMGEEWGGVGDGGWVWEDGEGV